MTIVVPRTPTGVSTARRTRAPAAARREQAAADPFFDNAKFLAILLVVAGHSIVDLRDVRARARGSTCSSTRSTCRCSS